MTGRPDRRSTFAGQSSRAGFALVPLLALLLAACATGDPGRCPAGSSGAIGDSLYFGTAMPDGTVSPEQWEEFVATEVTPRFPDGLTQWRATGQWLSKSNGLTREDSYVLYFVHPDTPEHEQSIKAITERYRLKFHQEAVLRVRSSVCISF